MNYMTAKGFLTDNERRALVHYARDTRLEHGVIVNIGVEYGASLVCLFHGNPAARIFGIDIDVSKNLVSYVWLLEMDSGEAAKSWWPADKEIDLLFVDGDHSYEGVVRDLYWTYFVRPGGYVLFHDCYDWPPAPPKQVHSICPGVNQAVREWAEINAEFYNERDHVDTMRIFRRIK